jgi:hypothetical protein
MRSPYVRLRFAGHPAGAKIGVGCMCRGVPTELTAAREPAAISSANHELCLPSRPDVMMMQ